LKIILQNVIILNTGPAIEGIYAKEPVDIFSADELEDVKKAGFRFLIIVGWSAAPWRNLLDRYSNQNSWNYRQSAQT
jgi:hypothetical protein